jgi:cytochrome bd-type quinol oxidase subunit 2
MGGIFLIKNNLKSLLIHITLSVLFIFTFTIFFAAQPKWDSEEAARNYHNIMLVISIIMLVIAPILYNYLGKRHLKKQENLYKNLFSVSLPAIVGVVLWVYAFNIDKIGPSNQLLNSEFWRLYSMFNGYSVPFIDVSESDNPYLFLVFSFIPTLCMWTGLQRKK